MTRIAYRGADKIIGYHFPTGTDLTGYSAAMSIYDAMGGTLLLKLTTVPDVAGSIVTVDPLGVITCDLKAADIDAFPYDDSGTEGPTLVYFDVIIAKTDGTYIKLDGGALSVRSNGAPLGGCCDEITVSIDGDCYDLDFCNTTFERGVAGATGAQGNQGETGSPGRIGETGAQGADGDDGVNVVPKGPYDNAATYNPLEGVQWEGSFYYLGGSGTSTGVAPPSSPWELFVAKGADGVSVPSDDGASRRYYIDIPDTIVDWMDVNGYFNTSFDDDGHLTSPETDRLDTIESTGPTIRYYSDKYTGALEVSQDNAVLVGKLVNGPVQTGATPDRQFFCDVRGTVGSRTVWISGDGISAFQISNGFDTGDNFGAYILGSYVYWMNSTSGPRREALFMAAPDMPSGVQHLRLAAWTGQSTSNGTANETTVTPTPPNDYVFMWNAGSRVLANDQGPTRNLEPLPDNSLWSLVPAHEQVAASSGETQVTQCSYELQWRLGNAYAVVGATVGIGSQSYNNMKKGTVPYQNLLDVVKATWLAAMLNGLTFDVAICLPEFEAEQLDSQATYYAILQQFQADLTTDINLLCNRTGEVALCSDGYANFTSYGYETSEESLAQLQAAITDPTKFIYSGPAYLYPAIVSDNIHRTPAGAALDGACNGRALSKHFKGQDPLPLHVESFAVISGGYVDLQLHKPYNSTSLTATSPLVTALTNHGVSCVRQDNGAAVSVFSVTITDAALYTVRVALSAPPSGAPLWLEVGGYRGVAGQPSGPVTGARSPINDGCADTSYFGTAMPNHLAQQRLSVTF